MKRRINFLWALCSVQWVRWTFKRSPWGRLIDTESTLWQMWSVTKTDWSHCTANRLKVVPVGPAEVTDFRRMCHKCWPNFKQPGAQDVSVVFGRSFRTHLHSSKLWALALLYANWSSIVCPTGSQDTLPPPRCQAALLWDAGCHLGHRPFLRPQLYAHWCQH